jgi:RNA polymerase sigma factor (sigma-70 family)
MNNIMENSNANDSELTSRAAAGHRDAFAQIVTRYQSLVCSLAYSATGSLSQSEDLAQETFLAAWRGLPTLREPEKLRSWLCSIARNIIASAMRCRKMEPANTDETIEALADVPSPESLPIDRVISCEEEAILWRSMDHIPQIYREPLILFYREGQCIESVAQALELSDEAVKQRLSRGRKLLKMEVEAFVENALRQSAPGRKFTSNVLAVLPVLAMPAGASALGAASSKGLAAAKSGSLLCAIGGLLVPIFGALSGFLSLAGIVKSAQSPREKSLWIKATVIFYCIFITGFLACFWFRNNERLFVLIFSVQFFATILVCIISSILTRRLRKRIQLEAGQVQKRANGKQPFGNPESKGFKWNAYACLLGLTFCNPFAMLIVNAAVAHDSMVVTIILAILVVSFFFSRQIFFKKQERAVYVLRGILIFQFPLLLAFLYLRWEKWTGLLPWQMRRYDLILPAVGFFLFVFGIIHCFLKGKNTVYPNFWTGKS